MQRAWKTWYAAQTLQMGCVDEMPAGESADISILKIMTMKQVMCVSTGLITSLKFASAMETLVELTAVDADLDIMDLIAISLKFDLVYQLEIWQIKTGKTSLTS